MNSGEEGTLVRRLGLAQATISGLGVIVGAGIYVLIGLAAQQAGNAVWLSFVIAAFGASLTGVSYARLVKLRPKNAPEMQYVTLAFGRTSGFLAGWFMLGATIVSAAAVALGFAGYMTHLLGIPSLPAALGLIAVSSFIAFWGIGQSVLITAVLIVPTLIGLLVIAGIGIPYLGDVDPLDVTFGFTGVIGAASLVFFAYIGFQSIANLSEEMRNPERDLPKAIILVLVLSTLLYVLVSLSAVSVLGWEELGAATAPLSIVAGQALGESGDLVISLMSLTATASTVLVLLVTASRAMWAMSCAGVLPMTFCVVGKRRRTPWPTIVLVALLASSLVTMRGIQDIAEFTNFAILLTFAAVNLAAAKLLRHHSSGRLSGLFMNIIVPGLGVVVSLGLAVLAGRQAAQFGAMLLGTGAALYLGMYLWSKVNRK